MSGRCVLGVDLGGTNVRAVVIGEDGRKLGPNAELPSKAKKGADATLKALASAISQARSNASAEPEAIGIAAPGHITGGTVRWAPNFGEVVGGEYRCWRNVEVGVHIEKLFGLPVRMGNDANLAALGEYMFGSGKGTAGLVMFTLGTGVGSGVVICRDDASGDLEQPFLVTGSNGGAVEFGHVSINAEGEKCSCGSIGCLEAYCGAEGLLRIARSGFPATDDLSPMMLFNAAERGDKDAQRVWERYGRFLGIGIANAVNAFSPEIVAVGGRIANAAEWFLPTAIAAAEERAIPSLYETVRIQVAERLDDAGLLGAGFLALEAAR